MSGHEPIPEEKLRKMMEEAAEQGTRRAFLSMGMNINDPIETQKDMAYVRLQRQASEQLGKAVRRTVLAILITGMASALWVGITFAVNKPHP